MTNALAIWIFIVIGAFLAVDGVFFDWSNSLFLGQKGASVLIWMAFWR